MKRITVALAAAVFMMSTVPAFSEMTQSQKDECLLASKNCSDQVDDIQKRIHKLDKEIKKGKKVYSADELKKLQQKLKETQEILYNLETRPGS
jgi:peptidoglycan hydrolase CwlO-like protein